MPLVGQERGAEQWHHNPVQQAKGTAAVGLCDQNKLATRFEDPVDLSNIRGQIGPVVMRLHRGDQIERAIRERQCGDGGLFYPYSAGLDCLRVSLLGNSDAGRRKIDSNNMSLGCYGRELLHG